MVDILSMVDLTSISAMLAATGVLVGVIFAVLELRNLTKTRQTDLTMRLYQHLDTREFMDSWWQVATRKAKDYKEYVQKYGATELLQVSVFFEGLGMLLHKKLMDFDLASDFFGESCKRIWEENESILKEMHADKCFWFEYLYNELQKREQALQQTPQ